MAGIEEIHRGAVRSLEQGDFQFSHEATGDEPEIVTHRHDRLEVLGIAMPKRGDELRANFTALGLKPLLELVEDQQNLAIVCQDAPPAQMRQSFDQDQFSRKQRTCLPQALEQSSFCFLWG